MTIYEETLKIPTYDLDYIEKVLNFNPTTKDECLMGEDDTISYTVTFSNGIEADVKICGVEFEEDSINTPWTEVVLFENGYEVCCSEPEDDILGDWNLEYNDDEYIIHIGADDYE